MRRRLVLTFMVLTAVLLLPAVYAATQLSSLRDMAVVERSRHASATLAVGRFQAALSTLDRFARSHIAAPDPGLREGMESSLQELRTQLGLLREYGYGPSADSLSQVVRAVEADVEELDALVAAGSLDAAAARFSELAALMASSEELLDRVAGTIDERSRGDFRRAREVSSSAAFTTWAGLLLALFLAGAVAYWTTDALTSPLNRLRRGLGAVGEGEFHAAADLPYERQDEIGDLARSYRWMTERLAELDRMKAEFVGVATHELKNPIHVIHGYSALLEEGLMGPVSPQQVEVLQSVQEQTRILARLVSRLLEISRLEAGAYPMQAALVEVESLFAGVRRGIGILAGQKGIRLELKIDPSAPRKVVMDEDLIRNEVLGNLLGNALKFTPKGGNICLDALGEEGRLVLEVSDTGPGIPEDQAGRVFEKYYQVGPKDRDFGSGLGLAIAREIVEAHGGTIALIRKEGRGATFRIELPVDGPPPAPEDELANGSSGSADGASSRSGRGADARRRVAPAPI